MPTQDPPPEPVSNDELLVFYGCGAIVASIEGRSRCRIWIDPLDPASNAYPTPIGPVDFSKTPENGWSTVEVEAYDPGKGLTTIRPPFPFGRGVTGDPYSGMVYLEQAHYQQWTTRPVEDDDGEKYEFTTLCFRQGLKRYRGFHVSIEDVRNNTALVFFYRAGKSKALRGSEQATGRRAACPMYYLDLTPASQLYAPGFSVALEAGAQGPLFVDVDWAQAIALEEPKRPPNLGW